MGAFGIKIPTEYGGLGLSYSSYVQAMALVTSKDGSLTALLSAHQSIGVPQPLKLFGNDEQKKRYFPRLAKGAISAFALTEVDAGSDPANMHAHAEPSADGQHFDPERRKALVHQRHARRAVRRHGAHARRRSQRQEDASRSPRSSSKPNWPGVEVVHRCRFMGLKAIENGVIRFTNVQSPAREHSLGRREGAQARADHAQHRAPDAPRERGRRRQGAAAGIAHVGAGARAVGPADRQARSGRAEDRDDGGEHLRDGIDRRPHRRTRRAGGLRHPARGGDREDVQHRARLAHRRRHAADPRRPRLRDGRLAARARRAPDSRSSARCATRAST